MSPMLALYSWPVISAVLLRRFNLPLGILLVIVAGYMFLPSRFAIDFPMIPPLDKNVVPVLTVVLLCVLMAQRASQTPNQAGWMPKSNLARLLIVALIVSPFATSLTNPDPLVYEVKRLPALRLYDGFSTAIIAALTVLPALVGRKYFARPDMHRLILIVLCLTGCAYTILALYEVRFSPQINRWFYGFTSHMWVQHVRGDGFRPMVFMEHGLRVSLFFAMALIATLGLVRMGWKLGPTIAAAGWIAITLVLCKSLGAVMIALMLTPVVLFLSIRMMILVAAVIGFSVIAYPMLRGSGLAPVEWVMEQAATVDPDRAASFLVRLENEDQLLARAQQRPLFGWGGWERSRVRDERGNDDTIADGYWIIIIGKGGWVRYVGEFGLMTLPMLFLFFYRGRMNISRETAILSVLLAGNMIDLIPNSGITPITWLIAGALWGRLEVGDHTEDPSGAPPAEPSEPDPRHRYTRDFGKSPIVRQQRRGPARGQQTRQARST
ncbi:MAG: hypothetical protein ACPGSW_00120 [Phaeobacter italicus]